MKISVIIPARDAERWIAQCVENLLAQTCKDVEIIVVDDGSTDRTAEIVVESYPAVRLVRQAHKGVSAARNAGLDAATGEYIHFMDVDDLLNLDYYERMARAVAGGADMAFGGFVYEAVPGRTQLYSESWFATVAEDKFALSNVGASSCVWRYAIKKSLIDRHHLRFVVGQSLMEDTLFTIEAVHLAASIVTVPGAVYCYKNRSGSVTRNPGKGAVRRRAEQMALGKQRLGELMNRYGIDPNLRAQRVERLWKYKIIGLPILEKRVMSSGKVRWYLFGLRVAQAKQVVP